MPTPGKAWRLLEDPARKALGELLYPFYDSLSHFTHGGLMGVMQAALLRREDDESEQDRAVREKFWYSSIIEANLPASYISQLTVATLFAQPILDAALRERLVGAWRPYHCDGSPLGVAVWDCWAAEALGEKA